MSWRRHFCNAWILHIFHSSCFAVFSRVRSFTGFPRGHSLTSKAWQIEGVSTRTNKRFPKLPARFYSLTEFITIYSRSIEDLVRVFFQSRSQISIHSHKQQVQSTRPDTDCPRAVFPFIFILIKTREVERSWRFYYYYCRWRFQVARYCLKNLHFVNSSP